jgi:uncharacterized protein (TIGR00299 family) protein
MRTIYIDCVSGIAGDMTLAALVDAGADVSYISAHLKTMPLDAFEMSFERVNRRGISANYLHLSFNQPKQGKSFLGHVVLDAHEHRKASDIFKIITESALPDRVKHRSLQIFQVVAEAEAKIHGMAVEDVHFHEVGAMDSIIDTIGVCLALESLGVDEIIVSPIPTGHGRKQMAHGLYPIPAPATTEILCGVPLSKFTAEGELTTPTGAGIAKALAKRFGELPEGVIEKIGYGAGTKDFAHPNILRVMLFEEIEPIKEQETIDVLEAQVDDTTGELLGYTMERLLAAGALDVYYTPVFMKKNRPGVLMTVVCRPAQTLSCEQIILRETSTFGVRRQQMTRTALDRKWVEVETPYGIIRVKQAFEGNERIHQSPEYEDAAAAARMHGVSLQTVYAETLNRLPK